MTKELTHGRYTQSGLLHKDVVKKLAKTQSIKTNTLHKIKHKYRGLIMMIRLGRG